jgi:hypothetical protein
VCVLTDVAFAVLLALSIFTHALLSTFCTPVPSRCPRVTAQRTSRRLIGGDISDPCKWVDSDEQVGAMEGSVLRVDCGAEGKPEPRVSITDEDGAPLSGMRRQGG